MEAEGITLSDDEVRERFSAYHEGDLPDGERAFIAKRLAEDPSLAAEYEKFRGLLAGLATLSLDAAPGTRAADVPALPKIDLLSNVQKRLNKRSGGKFYGTRWSRRAGIVPLEIIAVAVLVLLLVVYLAMGYITPVRAARPAGGGSAPPASAPPAAP
jgi:hypothetical protein